MYDKCYFCLDQLPKLKKESTASFFVNFGRSRGTKEPTYITVYDKTEQYTKRGKRIGFIVHYSAYCGRISTIHYNAHYAKWVYLKWSSAVCKQVNYVQCT